jgi:hypothetical protein
MEGSGAGLCLSPAEKALAFASVCVCQEAKPDPVCGGIDFNDAMGFMARPSLLLPSGVSPGWLSIRNVYQKVRALAHQQKAT